MMRIAIVGSRDYPTEKPIKNLVLWLHSQNPDYVIVSGGARGVDDWAVKQANQLGMPTKVFHANWDRFGKKAGMIRNRYIVSFCDMVFAFWDEKSPGTMNTIDLAKYQGKQVYVYNVQGVLITPSL